MIQHFTDAVLCQSFHQSVAVKHPLAPQSPFQIVVKSSFGKPAGRLQELPPIKDPLVQHMINVRFRTLLEELPPVKEPIIQSMINVRFCTLLEELPGNATALVERVSTKEEFLPPRMVVDVRCR